MEIHFLRVGCGSMTMLLFPGRTVWFCDCNITEENESAVFSYLQRVMVTPFISTFVCSHRDADHMRGIKKLHARYPILRIRDAGVPGTTTTSNEYLNYMDLRRRVPSDVINPRTFQKVGAMVVRWMNSHYGDFSDANDQSIVMKVENGESSVLLAGDTSYRPWKTKIMPRYNSATISSSILLASHHGSSTFFDDPSDEKHYYTDHIRGINPGMTIISVGPNPHGLPDAPAVRLYEKFSVGSSKGNKVYRTDTQGNIKLLLKADGGWTIYPNQ